MCPSFLFERSQLGTAATPESPHKLSKPLPPSRPPPEVLWASCLKAVVRVAVCFLNFSIIVNKSIPQPLVIGVFLSRNGWLYSFSHSSLCSAIWQLLLIARVFLFCHHYLLLPFCLHDNSELSLLSDSWEGLGSSRTRCRSHGCLGLSLTEGTSCSRSEFRTSLSIQLLMLVWVILA